MTPHHRAEPDGVRTPLALIKLGEVDLAGIVGRVVEAARNDLAGATDVSITVVRADGPYTAAVTSDRALRLDESQYLGRLGPCLQAATEQATVLIADTAHDTRWNNWPARAAAAGAASVLSVGLPILDGVDGALNVYSHAADAFDRGAVAAAQAFAQRAAVTLANAYLYDRTATLAAQMQTAMAHRAVIEQAKGIIMREHRCTPEEAFAVLTRISQNSNRKLRDIAAALVTRAQSPSDQVLPPDNS